MSSRPETVEQYLARLPEDRRAALGRVRDVVNEHLPEGYVESLEGQLITWSVPLELAPDTYNGKPLGYVALASQKQHMAVYLMGLYTEGPELAWFRQQYADRGLKLDMGKSCLRFKKLDDLPLDVLGEVIAMIPVAVHVARYAASRENRK